MTNKTITLSREHVERLIERLSKSQMFKETTELRAALVDPVPPVGGDVEVRTFYAREIDLDNGFVECIAAADHRAHVTRLQAEVERLKQTAPAEGLRSALAECIKQRDALQSELTKARGLLVRWVIQSPAHAERLISETKAALGNFKVADEKCGRCGAATACGKMLCEACCYEPIRAAGKGQGEPVAWSYCPECGCKELHHEEGEHKQCANCHQEWFSDIDYSDVVRGNLQKLKAEQPAPVAGLRSALAECIRQRDALKAAPVAVVMPDLDDHDRSGQNYWADQAAQGRPYEQQLREACERNGIDPGLDDE